MTRESNIVYENGDYWVYRDRDSYVVYKIGSLVSTPDSAYEKSPDGLSIAIARCDYLANR